MAKTEKITIEIEHELTPFFTEIMNGMLIATLETLRSFWNNKTTGDVNETAIKRRDKVVNKIKTL